MSMIGVGYQHTMDKPVSTTPIPRIGRLSGILKILRVVIPSQGSLLHYDNFNIELNASNFLTKSLRYSRGGLFSPA
ncbi:uncharacterized protein ARMOST_01287 [Armillaria ostoyae]|uniref:Uncharacterized protein n=1 Tax=Armillaria ostoyae TaxID=47428 RepID=A0A284QNJ0_ARMOS|nr:uncharacterized protein ARMOST_01287 [Armillaria ostoyae]